MADTQSLQPLALDTPTVDFKKRMHGPKKLRSDSSGSRGSKGSHGSHHKEEESLLNTKRQTDFHAAAKATDEAAAIKAKAVSGERLEKMQRSLGGRASSRKFTEFWETVHWLKTNVVTSKDF